MPCCAVLCHPRRGLYFEASRSITRLTVSPDNLEVLVAMPLHAVMPGITHLALSTLPGGASSSASKPWGVGSAGQQLQPPCECGCGVGQRVVGVGLGGGRICYLVLCLVMVSLTSLS